MLIDSKIIKRSIKCTWNSCKRTIERMKILKKITKLKNNIFKKLDPPKISKNKKIKWPLKIKKHPLHPPIKFHPNPIYQACPPSRKNKKKRIKKNKKRKKSKNKKKKKNRKKKKRNPTELYPWRREAQTNQQQTIQIQLQRNNNLKSRSTNQWVQRRWISRRREKWRMMSTWWSRPWQTQTNKNTLPFNRRWQTFSNSSKRSSQLTWLPSRRMQSY